MRKRTRATQVQSTLELKPDSVPMENCAGCTWGRDGVGGGDVSLGKADTFENVISVISVIEARGHDDFTMTKMTKMTETNL